MGKSTLVAFLAVFIALLQIFHPVYTAPTILNQISHPLHEHQPLSHPFTETINKTNERCDICDEVKNTDICYFDCLTSTDYPKGHTYCNECILKVAVRDKPCPLCRADMNGPKVQSLLNNPILYWNYMLENLKYLDMDITKQINQLGEIVIKKENLKTLLLSLTQLLYTGSSFYSNEIQPIVFNAINIIRLIQIEIRKNHEYKIGYDKYILHTKRNLVKEYFQYGHFEVVKEIMLQSNYETNKYDVIDQLMQSSFKYKSTTFLYDYMKNNASKQEKEYLIENVIQQSTDTCFLDGLLELIHSIFGYDTTLMEDLTIQVLKKSQYKYQNTGDMKCSLASTKDCRNYLRNYITLLSTMGKLPDIIEIYNKNQELFPIN